MKALKQISIGAVVLVAACAMAKDVHVTWNPSADSLADPSISYNVFVYTNSTLTSNDIFTVVKSSNTNASITNLAVGTRYWANVQAVDTNGLTSDFSNAASFIYPGAPTSIHLVP